MYKTISQIPLSTIHCESDIATGLKAKSEKDSFTSWNLNFRLLLGNFFYIEQLVTNLESLTEEERNPLAKIYMYKTT